MIKKSNLSNFLKLTAATLMLATIPSVAAEVDVIQPADSLPATTPWDLKSLSQPPAFKWAEGDEVRENLHFVPNLRHGHVFDRPKAIEVFIAHHLKQGPGLAEVTSVKHGDTQITAEVNSSNPLLKAQIHYTTGDLTAGAKDREWLSLPAAIEAAVIKAPLPPGHTRAWFLTFEDHRDTLVSSPLVFPKPKQ